MGISLNSISYHSLAQGPLSCSGLTQVDYRPPIQPCISQETLFVVVPISSSYHFSLVPLVPQQTLTFSSTLLVEYVLDRSLRASFSWVSRNKLHTSARKRIPFGNRKSFHTDLRLITLSCVVPSQFITWKLRYCQLPTNIG